MGFVQLYTIFTNYGLDILIVAFVVCLLTNVLKRTLLKGLKNKYYTFLPLILGTLFYLVYLFIIGKDMSFIKDNAYSIFENTIKIGCIATFIYSIFEQFFRKGTLPEKHQTLSPYLENIIEKEKIEQVAKTLCEIDLTDEVVALENIKNILESNAQENTTKNEIQFFSTLIFSHLSLTK